MATIQKMSQKASQKSSKSDKELKRMEKKIDGIYSQYASEMTSKWDKYMSKVEDKLSAYTIAMQEAYKTGDALAIKEAVAKYQDALAEMTIKNQEYQTMVFNTSLKMASVNQIALDYVNDKMPSVYAFSYNALEKQVSNIKGYSFDLVDESTVKKLAQQKEIQLPKKQLDVSKDTKWNAKQINSQMMQGILQGEPISQIAKRLESVSDMNTASAKRNARTMYTSCENAGRQDSYEKASADGVIMHKVWMSAQDDRTRESHIEADGQEVDVDEPFILINRDGSISELMYPADPNGDPEQVYNCRCTMITKFIGFRKKEED